ncbi:hypothetical protein BN946_scf184707.g15 [Trametes cinnabarina]|uniref:Uncharacterized protein n=1 Tax=Pycnoporus cinnabarinus TaxID=5643 RepID=A0A060S838_PYCCI|nr:hypothetical protein BN946_scf184707.g15 [Trametes cinnabarina]
MCPHVDKRILTRRRRGDSALIPRQLLPLGGLFDTADPSTSLFGGMTSTLRVVSKTSGTLTFPLETPVNTPASTTSEVGTMTSLGTGAAPSPTSTFSSQVAETSDTWDAPATTSQAIDVWDSIDVQSTTSQWSSTETTFLPVQTTTQVETTLVSVPYTVSVPESSTTNATISLVTTSTSLSSPDQSGAQQVPGTGLTDGQVAAVGSGAGSIIVLFLLLCWWGKRRKRDKRSSADEEPGLNDVGPNERRSPVTIVPDVQAAFNSDLDATSQPSPVHSVSNSAETGTRVGTLESIEEEKDETYPVNSSRESLIGPELSVRSSSTLSYINTLCPETAESPSTTAAARVLPLVPTYDASRASQPGTYTPPAPVTVGFRPLPRPVAPTPFTSMYVPEERASLDSAAYGSVEATVSLYSLYDGGVVRYTGGVYTESADGQPPEYSRY